MQGCSHCKLISFMEQGKGEMRTYFLEEEDATHRKTRISLSKVSRQNSPKCEYDSMGDIFGAPTIHPRYWSKGGLKSSHNSNYRSVFSDCDSSENLGKISSITGSSLCDMFDETFDNHLASKRKDMQPSGSSKHPRALNSTCGSNPFKKTVCQELLTMNGKPEAKLRVSRLFKLQLFCF